MRYARGRDGCVVLSGFNAKMKQDAATTLKGATRMQRLGPGVGCNPKCPCGLTIPAPAGHALLLTQASLCCQLSASQHGRCTALVLVVVYSRLTRQEFFWVFDLPKHAYFRLRMMLIIATSRAISAFDSACVGALPTKICSMDVSEFPLSAPMREISIAAGGWHMRFHRA